MVLHACKFESIFLAQLLSAEETDILVSIVVVSKHSAVCQESVNVAHNVEAETGTCMVGL